jgi:5-methylcytosine-specific restriction endonuclease McrA
MPRRDFPRKVRQAAIDRADGHCEKCGAALKVGEAEVDHILEAGFGGGPGLENAQVLCKPCHTPKTADGIRRMRKADRARDKASGAMLPAARPIQSRGFPTRKSRAPKPALAPKQLYTKQEQAT